MSFFPIFFKTKKTKKRKRWEKGEKRGLRKGFRSDGIIIILDGNSEHVAHVGKYYFLTRNFRLVIALDLNKCLTNRSSNRDPSIRAQLCLNFHLI